MEGLARRDLAWFDARMRSRVPLVVAGGLLVMAAVFGTAAGVLAVRTASFLAGAERAGGVVVGLDERAGTGDGSARYTYRAVVAYGVAGQEHLLTDRIGSDPPRYDVGERVTVLYDPANPADARIGTRYGYWLETIFGGVALALAGAGLAILTAWSRTAAHRRLTGTGERATGVVTDVRPAGRVVWNGRPRTATTVGWRHPFAGEQTLTDITWGAPHAVGDQVNLRYDADRPTRAVVEPPAGPAV
ncbi:Protein of unknown function (DUF3592) [Promicromonospora thailandica]|uniref:DUF3592 domain-containing protein n=2 Tax=Promicromonospora thailandica TaxID=765201 RepID=A0A9X2G6X3_9MICO|nr:Protein of unknown function (DUF3592) [Promicromonospora thailandica]BFF20955.1 hypothetical protein GCM10025730_44760 [Promicromonospora thailandica]